MQTIYIYTEPFNGTIQNTMHNGKVDYTGEEVRTQYTDKNGSLVTKITFPNALTFEEYKEFKKPFLDGKELKTATEEEINALFLDYENTKVLTEFEEITEEKYNDLLECLPPKRWHKYKGLELFFMGECYTSNIYTCCIFHPDEQKYYSALRRITETDEEILQTFLKSIGKE